MPVDCAKDRERLDVNTDVLPVEHLEQHVTAAEWRLRPDRWPVLVEEAPVDRTGDGLEGCPATQGLGKRDVGHRHLDTTLKLHVQPDEADGLPCGVPEEQHGHPLAPDVGEVDLSRQAHHSLHVRVVDQVGQQVQVVGLFNRHCRGVVFLSRSSTRPETGPAS